MLRSVLRRSGAVSRAPAVRCAPAALPSPLPSCPLLSSAAKRGEERRGGVRSLTLSSPLLSDKFSFQAETKQLLDIVTHALYTDKHVFLRELISNASDALEKARHMQSVGKPLAAPSAPLCINITLQPATPASDGSAGTPARIILQDSGIGMTREEMIDHLGTIAKSGSKAFINQLKNNSNNEALTDAASNIIGQFGVGFYSAFMVADRVIVHSRSGVADAPATVWSSDGSGSFDVDVSDLSVEQLPRGTRIILELKTTAAEFANAATVKDIITKYSNFVSFPISLDGKQLNTVGALWSRSKSDVSDEQYNDFYKYKSGDFEPPLYRLHFSTDAPIALKALLFVGSSHDEKFGMGRIKPGVDLYSRRVLIEASSAIMPDWLRFVHGVVDSEDIPLNISRESMQDSALMKRLKSVVTRRVLRFLESEARSDPDKFANVFFPEFGNFLKEGAVSDPTYSADIAKLLRFESSQMDAGKLTSLDEYVSRMSPGQKDIYYLVAPHRGLAETSPYMEAFRGAHDGGSVEVLFLYSPLDDFVMNNLREFNGRKLSSAEKADLDPKKLKDVGNTDEASKEEAGGKTAAGLTATQVAELGSWFQKVLPKRISKVRATARLKSSPAVVTDHESAAIRRMMRMVEQTAGRDSEGVRAESHMLPAQSLEVNPTHPVIVKLFSLKDSEPKLALLVAEQVLDNALIAAGLIDDSRVMLPRLNALLEYVAGSPTGSYTSMDDINAKRFTSEKEADERAGLERAKATVDELLKQAPPA